MFDDSMLTFYWYGRPMNNSYQQAPRLESVWLARGWSHRWVLTLSVDISTVIVWKMVGQHLFLNIIPKNFTAGIGWKLWCDRAWEPVDVTSAGRKCSLVSVGGLWIHEFTLHCKCRWFQNGKCCGGGWNRRSRFGKGACRVKTPCAKWGRERHLPPFFCGRSYIWATARGWPCAQG